MTTNDYYKLTRKKGVTLELLLTAVAQIQDAAAGLGLPEVADRASTVLGTVQSAKDLDAAQRGGLVGPKRVVRPNRRVARAVLRKALKALKMASHAAAFTAAGTDPDLDAFVAKVDAAVKALARARGVSAVVVVEELLALPVDPEEAKKVPFVRLDALAACADKVRAAGTRLKEAHLLGEPPTRRQVLEEVDAFRLEVDGLIGLAIAQTTRKLALQAKLLHPIVAMAATAAEELAARTPSKESTAKKAEEAKVAKAHKAAKTAALAAAEAAIARHEAVHAATAAAIAGAEEAEAWAAVESAAAGAGPTGGGASAAVPSAAK